MALDFLSPVKIVQKGAGYLGVGPYAKGKGDHGGEGASGDSNGTSLPPGGTSSIGMALAPPNPNTGKDPGNSVFSGIYDYNGVFPGGTGRYGGSAPSGPSLGSAISPGAVPAKRYPKGTTPPFAILPQGAQRLVEFGTALGNQAKAVIGGQPDAVISAPAAAKKLTPEEKAALDAYNLAHPNGDGGTWG